MLSSLLTYAYRLLYQFLITLLLPFALLRLLIKARTHPDYRYHWQQRLGLVTQTQKQAGPVIWLHAVSVGEVIASAPLVQQLRLQYPTLRLLVSTTTPTGRVQAARRLNADNLFYLPFDTFFIIRRTLARLKPDLVILMETEIWPNLIQQCRRAGIPTLLANARLSERSFKRYQKLGALSAHVIRQLSHIAVRNPQDADYFQQLAGNDISLTVAGNIKFDIQVDRHLISQAQSLLQRWQPTDMLWIAASTHPGEDELMLQAHQQLLLQHPQLKLILAPRHPERADTLQQQLADAGLQALRYSKIKQVDTFDTQVILVDTLGDLMTLYAASDITVVAGSFVPHGGHNPIEPAVLAKPVISGPFIRNFTEEYRVLTQADAALVLTQPGIAAVPELVATLDALLRQASRRQMLGIQAQRVVADQQQATRLLVGLVDDLLAGN